MLTAFCSIDDTDLAPLFFAPCSASRTCETSFLMLVLFFSACSLHQQTARVSPSCPKALSLPPCIALLPPCAPFDSIGSRFALRLPDWWCLCNPSVRHLIAGSLGSLLCALGSFLMDVERGTHFDLLIPLICQVRLPWTCLDQALDHSMRKFCG